MNYIATWKEVILASLQNIWGNVVGFLPEFVGALVVLLVGISFASLLGRGAKKVMHYTHVDKLVERVGLDKKFENIGMHLSVSGVVGWIVEWFFIVVVLIAVVDILHLDQVTQFLKDVALYIPNVVVAVIILVIGLVIGQFTYQIVGKSAHASHLTQSSADILAALSKWSIVIFSLMAGLSQLGIATGLIQILFTGLVAMLALAFGLAFGLGGKEAAQHYLEELRHKGK